MVVAAGDVATVVTKIPAATENRTASLDFIAPSFRRLEESFHQRAYGATDAAYPTTKGALIDSQFPTIPANGCRACGHDFAGLRYFDAHRVGKHEYTFSEGLRMEPPLEDGRRCLTVDEMRAMGWETNARGRWFSPTAAELTRQHFAEAA